MARVGLSFSDRSEISTASKAGWSVRRIARHLGRCPSVILRELHRNSTKTRGYQAVTADVRAQRRRARPQPAEGRGGSGAAGEGGGRSGRVLDAERDSGPVASGGDRPDR
ncbi:helix-turn-helix domain-containing protein [Rothia kristinae]|uniref:helix-turn-helix domain-containing protein n=1 Tax=Rothia kristinae TaxID=37923 RepID=UPI0022E8A773|nr:helix-turn-helix domain-containing protein [Rothia kristinae]